jgi:hypothetical protein
MKQKTACRQALKDKLNEVPLDTDVTILWGKMNALMGMQVSSTKSTAVSPKPAAISLKLALWIICAGTTLLATGIWLYHSTHLHVAPAAHHRLPKKIGSQPVQIQKPVMQKRVIQKTILQSPFIKKRFVPVADTAPKQPGTPVNLPPRHLLPRKVVYPRHASDTLRNYPRKPTNKKRSNIRTDSLNNDQ